MTKQSNLAKHREEIRAKDRAHILNPDLWPCWPLLPLKKLGASKETDGEKYGFLFATEKPWQKVYLSNMFTFADKVQTDPQLLTKLPAVEFTSVEELLDAGWYVD